MYVTLKCWQPCYIVLNLLCATLNIPWDHIGPAQVEIGSRIFWTGGGDREGRRWGEREIQTARSDQQGQGGARSILATVWYTEAVLMRSLHEVHKRNGKVVSVPVFNLRN